MRRLALIAILASLLPSSASAITWGPSQRQAEVTYYDYSVSPAPPPEVFRESSTSLGQFSESVIVDRIDGGTEEEIPRYWSIYGSARQTSSISTNAISFLSSVDASGVGAGPGHWPMRETTTLSMLDVAFIVDEPTPYSLVGYFYTYDYVWAEVLLEDSEGVLIHFAPHPLGHAVDAALDHTGILAPDSYRVLFEIYGLCNCDDDFFQPTGSAYMDLTLTFGSVPVPEPGTTLLLGTGLLALAGAGRRS